MLRDHLHLLIDSLVELKIIFNIETNSVLGSLFCRLVSFDITPFIIWISSQGTIVITALEVGLLFAIGDSQNG